MSAHGRTCVRCDAAIRPESGANRVQCTLNLTRVDPTATFSGPLLDHSPAWWSNGNETVRRGLCDGFRGAIQGIAAQKLP